MNNIILKKNKENIENFIIENNIDISVEDIQKILDQIYITAEIKCDIINDKNLFSELLYIDEKNKNKSNSFNKKISYPYGSKPYSHLPLVSVSKMAEIIDEEAIELLYGDNIVLGRVINDNKKLTPIFDPDKIYVILKYEKTHRWLKGTIINNPHIYIYCK